MTVEEMIRYVWDHNHDDEMSKAIEAKLKAAERLRRVVIKADRTEQELLNAVVKYRKAGETK